MTIRDLAGDGDHYAATVISASFRGKSRVQQHQMVYAALKGQMGGVLHALALQTERAANPDPPFRPEGAGGWVQGGLALYIGFPEARALTPLSDRGRRPWPSSIHRPTK